MIFNSFEFLWLFPMAFCMYFFITCRKKIVAIYPKIGNYLLIAISYGLFIKWEPVHALVLLWVTAITYLSACKIERDNAYGKKRYIVFAGISLSVLPLLFYKYYNFLAKTIEQLLGEVNLEVGLPGLNWVMPLGISFFTFQAVGYLADVYLKRINAEHNWWDYMLFICFFPQIASGPISKAKDLLPQIKCQRVFRYKQAVQGLKWILWGCFLKVVIADQLGLLVDEVYSNYQHFSGSQCLGRSIMYSFQIYCDFAGYSYMAVGVGELFGFELINNFRRPYLSQSVTEFWHRWHISLSIWLKDYIYIPLGGSRCSVIKNYWNILVTFLISGLWHGANWTFILWGAFHGLFQIIEKHIGINEILSKGILKGFRILMTFVVVSFMWIFFRMPTIHDAFLFVYKIATDFDAHFGLGGYIVLLFPVIAKDIIDEFKINSLNLFHHKYAFVRYATYTVLLLLIVMFGVFDGSHFIYASF